MNWRNREDLWNGVANLRRADTSPSVTTEPDTYVAFFVTAATREDGADKLFVALAGRGWVLRSFLNLQNATSVDDEAAEQLNGMALEAKGMAFSSLPDAPNKFQ